jgi:ubiquinone/menaquinone biosynthesis C-methylase UbiE
MPDVYATIAEADQSMQELLAGVLEIRAAEAQQRAMLDSYLAEVKLPDGADVLEVGCGTGAVSRVVANLDGVSGVTGVDPSPVFIAKATELGGPANLSFEQGDGRELRFGPDTFDLVIFHTVLCHLPGPDLALAEAFRVLRPGGQVAVFDGDYASGTVAIGAADPLQSCVGALLDVFMHDPWLVRKIRPLLINAGFEPEPLRSHGYIETENPTYLMTVIDRGIDVATATAQITEPTATALKAEARARVEAGTFFGFIGYASIIGRKP